MSVFYLYWTFIGNWRLPGYQRPRTRQPEASILVTVSLSSKFMINS